MIALPNKAILDVTVIDVVILEDSMPFKVCKITGYIHEIKDVEGFPNRLRGYEGSKIDFFTKELLSGNIVGKRVHATLEYRGDERGGAWWATFIKIIY